MRLMRRLNSLRALAAILLALAAGTGTAAGDDSGRFLAEVRQDVQKKDVKALMSLVCWDGAPDQARATVEKHLQNIVKRQPKAIALEAWSDFPFKATLKVSHKLSFDFGNGERGGIPVGDKAGRLMIAAPLDN
jgi:hypothetical protein